MLLSVIYKRKGILIPIHFHDLRIDVVVNGNVRTADDRVIIVLRFDCRCRQSCAGMDIALHHDYYHVIADRVNNGSRRSLFLTVIYVGTDIPTKNDGPFCNGYNNIKRLFFIKFGFRKRYGYRNRADCRTFNVVIINLLCRTRSVCYRVRYRSAVGSFAVNTQFKRIAVVNRVGC